MLVSKSATLCALALVALLSPLSATPVPVRFAEGVVHGFLVLRTLDGVKIADGDLLQVARGGNVEKRMVFRFEDGSMFEEKTVFTEKGVYALVSYELDQHGPAFAADTRVSLERVTGKYVVTTKARKDRQDKVLRGTLTLPDDVYNGMILTIVKDLDKGASEIVHFVAFTPEPRLIELEILPVGEHKVLIGDRATTATDYALKPRLGVWLTFFAKVLQRMPPDGHVWIAQDDVPAFVKFEGPLAIAGPVWRIELTSPRWPE